MLKYGRLLDCRVVGLYDQVDYNGEDVLAFALPIAAWLDRLHDVKRVARKVVCMTICETETVHPVYGELFKMFDHVVVSSDFCKKVFSIQFPENTFEVIRLYEEVPKLRLSSHNKTHYTFYHIGNVTDIRKQINIILKAFKELNLPGSRLVLKATCNTNVECNEPGVLVINGLLPQEQLDRIHDSCDCYVSFSHSEGVGMGAVEAALRDKPVILTEYGGAVEYVNTPYTIKCGRVPVGMDDFLFTEDLVWGEPDYNQLLEFMKDAYSKKLRYMNHEHTRILLEPQKIKTQLCTALGR